MKPSLYLETTIPSYLAAHTSANLVVAGKQALTHEFYETERYKYELFISNYVLQECGRGDPEVAKKRLGWLEDIRVLNVTPKVEPLANEYLRLLSIPQRSRMDAYHLAMCCVYGLDILLSWNCSHLGAGSMQIVQKHNDKHGLFTPKMMTPDSLVERYKEGNLDE